MKILSIETSCDETSVAVVEKKENSTSVEVLSNITATSLDLHAKTGGIIPEFAAREQIKAIIPTIVKALNESASMDYESWENAQKILQVDVDAIAVTYGPGLIGSLLVGVETAKTLSLTFNKPLVPVNHLLGHIFANFIQDHSQDPKSKIKYPFVALIVSGGHTDLVYFESVDKYKWLGGTRDDAAGECFDKCARLLGYPYPGGPKIAELASFGNAKNVPLPKIMTGDDFDFSFSGLKTAFMNVVNKEFSVARKETENGYSWEKIDIENLPTQKKQLLFDLCASLQESIIEVLIRKTLKAAKFYNVNTILLGGGVSANQKLTEDLKEKIVKDKLPIEIFVPQKKYTMDNGAMIGAYALLSYKPVDWEKINATPDLYFA
ncbi:MAG TPA: tRNA (adenosine(37)-N6)-threonylcarbamoyltransferase complex transferase subunit TsaD [Patescibacteria group bacterium]|nr:tRNA (adenosine(37)-N6)-threonylcarbamoyltransferase complex transferase subunit TsaD [Patescibacteria group bacterium]